MDVLESNSKESATEALQRLLLVLRDVLESRSKKSAAEAHRSPLLVLKNTSESRLGGTLEEMSEQKEGGSNAIRFS